ncbi:ABC transporter permease [bacterium]|nr:ABC transporter permease [bacterium]
MSEYSLKNTLSYRFLRQSAKDWKDFLVTFGNIGKDFNRVIKYILRLEIDANKLIEQSSRFAFDSLPITLTIVSMTAIIISMQISPELVKQGGGNFIGMMSAIVMTRELSAIMSGFAIISMIGSSFASELASMSVTDQISAMKVLRVDPVKYLIVPRVTAGFIMMPFVVILSSFVGLFFAGLVANITAGVSALNFTTSMWQGLFIKDIMVMLLKSAFFGGAIALISCSCGYSTRGGAKDVGISTTKAVVWSFLAIAFLDWIFAILFYM